MLASEKAWVRDNAENYQYLEYVEQEIEQITQNKESTEAERDRLASERDRLRAQVEQLNIGLVGRSQLTANASVDANVPEVKHYIDDKDRDLYTDWLTKLDRSKIPEVKAAAKKMRGGNYGDSKRVHVRDLFERRLKKSGVRIYYARVSRSSVIILGGGDKTDQKSDIEEAAARLDDWKARNPDRA